MKEEEEKTKSGKVGNKKKNKNKKILSFPQLLPNQNHK